MKTFKEFRNDVKERAALVANQTDIIDVVLKDLHALLLKQMGKDVYKGIFRFLGIELDKADVTPPSDASHFFFK